jgi:hypothetical protein
MMTLYTRLRLTGSVRLVFGLRNRHQRGTRTLVLGTLVSVEEV